MRSEHEFNDNYVGFTPQIISGAFEFVKVALEQIAWWKELIGTKCLVRRPKATSKLAQVYGSIYSNNLPGSDDFEEDHYVVLINLARIVKKYDETNEVVYFYDNNDYLKLGDVLVFSRLGREFAFKITEITTLGEMGDTLNYYAMTPFVPVEFEEEYHDKFEGNENIEDGGESGTDSTLFGDNENLED